MTILPEKNEDKNYIMCGITTDHINEVNEVISSCAYIEKWDPRNDTSDNDISSRMIKSNESKNGNKEIYDLKVIIKKDIGQIVGFLECCYGYPAKEYFCISDLEIKKEYQHQGIGQEVVNRVVNYIKGINEYSHLYVCVGLLNWPSLRFWSKIGFSRVINIFGDREYSDKRFSSVVLEM